MVSPVRRLLGYALRYRRDFLIGLVCVVLTRTVALASPTVLGYAVDDLRRGVTTGKLLVYGGVLLGIGIVGGVFLFLMRRILMGASRTSSTTSGTTSSRIWRRCRSRIFRRTGPAI